MLAIRHEEKVTLYFIDLLPSADAEISTVITIACNASLLCTQHYDLIIPRDIGERKGSPLHR
jgi:hypothetical protein